jgi:hypothetical protein
MVHVDLEAHLIRVEGLGPVDVGHGHHDLFDSPVHGQVIPQGAPAGPE